MKERLWLVRMIFVALVASLALPGCAALGEPASTEALLVRYAANDSNDNFHATADVDLVLSLVGYRVDIPIRADIDIVGTALHGSVRADLSKLDVDDYEAEIYAQEADGLISFYVGAKVDGSVQWREFELSALGPLAALGATNLLAAAEFNRIALDSNEAVRYELDIPTTTLLDTVLGIVDEAELPDEFDAELLRAALEGDKVRSYFTKDCLICSASTIAMGSYAGELSHGIPVSIKVDAKVSFDGYGEVDAATLAVPDEVRSAATHTDLHAKDPVGVLAAIGDDNPLSARING